MGGWVLRAKKMLRNATGRIVANVLYVFALYDCACVLPLVDIDAVLRNVALLCRVHELRRWNNMC